MLFLDAGVERAVMEVGLGGRLDSTNVVTPAVAVVTTIELEHTDKLGSTLGAIAAEKAGILKPGAPVVAGPLPGEARAVLAKRAAALRCPLAWLGRDFRVDVLEEHARGQRLRLRDGASVARSRRYSQPAQWRCDRRRWSGPTLAASAPRRR